MPPREEERAMMARLFVGSSSACFVFGSLFCWFVLSLSGE